MTTRNKNLKKVLPIVIISILLGSMVTAFAVPLLPMTVFGDVYVDLAPAGAGLNVYAKFGTTTIASTTTGATGNYLLSIPEASGVANGESIDLYVGTILADTVTLEYQNEPLELDLYVTGATPDTGTLTVITTPVSGEVFVGGTSWGVAPKSQVLAVGSYTVSFGAVTGYTTPVDQVAVVTKDTTTTKTGIYVLIPVGDTGTLSVDTTPVKGEVFVGGTSWGVAPKSQVLAVGSYMVSYGAFAGYTTPSPVSAIVTKDTVTLVMGTYVLITPDTPTESGFTAENIDITNKKKASLGEAGEKGHTIILEGDKDSIASGYELLVYWDKVQDWDGEKGFLNTTEADDDGGFEVWFKVPEADVGTHYLWFTATDQETKVMKAFTVISDCDISTSSGLQGAKIYVDLWGFAKNKDVAIFFIEEGALGYPAYVSGIATTDTVAVMDEIVDPEEDEYDGTLEHELIVPGTFVLHIGTATFHDNGAGKIYKNTEKCGSLNYVSGEWSIDLGDTVLDETGAFSADYNYLEDDAPDFFVLVSTGVTNSLGSWEDRRVTIPEAAIEQKYYVVGFDGKGNGAFAGFAIGATITLSTDEADVGDKIEVEGEGFPADTELQCKITRGSKTWDVHIIDSEDAPDGKDDDITNDEGEFEFDIIIPDTDKKDDDFKIHVYGGGYDAKASFEITGLAGITLSPEFGPQGSSITVSGTNYQNIKDKKVDVTLTDTDGDHIANIKKGVKVDSDGSFEADVTIPTENDGLYKIKVAAADDDDGEFNIDESKEFRIGTIMVLLSKNEAVVGDKIVLTGNGFEESGEWNATFGDVIIFEGEQCDNGLLKMSGDTPEFFVPQVEPGVYTILVWDVDAEITVETDFTVTEYTVLEFELVEAPHKFNVSIDGWNWPEVDGIVNREKDIEFLLYNDTDDWDMDVRMFGDPAGAEDNSETAYLNKTGFLNDAWWVVPKDDTLDMGIYWVNATIETDNDQEYFMQLKFVIGDVHKYISPRKTTFRITDTVSFNIQHTFGNDANQDVKGGDLKVYDPDGTLYWDGDSLNTWTKVETWYECPTSSQMASQNPMVLLDDAPIGTWTYKWRENAFGGRDTILEGSFNVEASAAEVLTEQINDINQAIDDMMDDMTGVSDSVAGLKTDINSAIQAANAAVDASNAAIEAVNAGVAQSAEAAAAAERAEAAAGKAQEAATGLTTLVYGAIGASLVAALAAIVSLMQISRRIAG